KDFHRLVTRFGELTGTPVLLNTSFNNNAEPIVQTVEDALTCYLTTELDYLVIENHLVKRKPHWTSHLPDAVLDFRPTTRLAEHLQITKCRVVTREIFLDYSTGPRASVSSDLFAVVEKADGRTTLGELGLTEDLHAELYALWQDRFFTLTPG
ncbi:carbamoyltransferase C-terminal domain-containing protein, partial [Amycolatopsis speibonae]